MDDDWSKFEQLAATAVQEMLEALRFYVINTDESRAIAKQHVQKASSYISQCDKELPLVDEQE